MFRNKCLSCTRTGEQDAHHFLIGGGVIYLLIISLQWATSSSLTAWSCLAWGTSEQTSDSRLEAMARFKRVGDAIGGNVGVPQPPQPDAGRAPSAGCRLGDARAVWCVRTSGKSKKESWTWRRFVLGSCYPQCSPSHCPPVRAG